MLITYDISDDKRRTAVFKTLMSQGDHVQFSVFLCSLNTLERASLRARLAGLINAAADQVLLVDLGPAPSAVEAVVECIGKRYVQPSRVQIF